jgi:hypothetical protein
MFLSYLTRAIAITGNVPSGQSHYFATTTTTTTTTSPYRYIHFIYL